MSPPVLPVRDPHNGQNGQAEEKFKDFQNPSNRRIAFLVRHGPVVAHLLSNDGLLKPV